MERISIEDSRNVCKLTMPKEMSDWFDERINSGQCVAVQDQGKIGYAMKSRDCTVVMYPNWNCDQQFKRIANKNRK